MEILPYLLVQKPPTCTSPQKRQANQLDYSSDEETVDIVEDKSDDKL